MAGPGDAPAPGAEPGAEPREEVRRIQQLDETVINRIAAGEVVVRPANALKELLENCLDAGSRNIVVALKGGGLKMLRIEDDGHGIREEDLPILCERFTTSKLRKYEDLNSIATFGFRGEALASISHVAHVTVTTMTAGADFAHIASYLDGKLKGPPRPCAGTRGTTLVVEDMFYNNSTRRTALGKDSVEHAKALEVVQKYAIHYPTVAFTCRKAAGSAVAELRTSGGDETTSRNVIGAVHGSGLAAQLFDFEASSEEPRFSCRGLASGPQWTQRSLSLTLFINHRLVECPGIRKAVEAVFAPVLPRHQHPWAYIALDIDPTTVDVNVHPTKQEVQFLFEEAIAQRIQEVLSAKLTERAGVRTFDAQSTLLATTQRQAMQAAAAAMRTQGRAGAEDGAQREPPPLADAATGVGITALPSFEALGAFAAGGASESQEPGPTQMDLDVYGATPTTQAAAPATVVLPPQVPKRVDLDPLRVRTDHMQRSLESVWRDTKASPAVGAGTPRQAAPRADEAAVVARSGDEGAPLVPHSARLPPFDEDQAAREAAFEEAQQLGSIAELAAGVARAAFDKDFVRGLNQSVYVGPVDRELVILQCGSALCLANLSILAREFAYQRLLRLFGSPGRITLKRPLPLQALLTLGIEDPESGYDRAQRDDSPTPEALAQTFVALLEEKAEMLHEYLMLDISDGKLWSLPNALGVTSDAGLRFDALPLFMVRLCAEVTWDQEKPCFEALCRLAADFCVEALLPDAEEAAKVMDTTAGGSTSSTSAGALTAAVEAGEFADVAEAAAAAKAKRLRTSGPNALQELRLLHEAIRNDAAAAGAAGACRWPAAFNKDGTVTRLVGLEQLYRIFERC